MSSSYSIPRFTHTETLPTLHQQSSTLSRRPALFGHFTYERSGRWVRCVLNIDNTCIVDSQHQLLVWEPEDRLPEYVFPVANVRTDLLRPSTNTDAAKGYLRPKSKHVEWFDLVVPNTTTVVPCVAWKYTIPELADWISLSWSSTLPLTWYEEDQQVHTHPRDPHVRVDAIPTSRHVQVLANHGAVVLADAVGCVAVCETYLPTRYYFAHDDVLWPHLVRVPRSTSCPYKGKCDDYWRVKLDSGGGGGDGEGTPVAWSYAEPVAEMQAIAGLVAFDSDQVQVLVDGRPFEGPNEWA